MVLVLLGHSAGVNAETANWRALYDRDVLSQQPACLLESATRTVHDGQTTTPMRIVYNGEAFVVVTRSSIDLSYPGVGLRVDHRPAHAIDNVHKDKSVVFRSTAQTLRREFSQGRVAHVALGFWPTWPKGETIVTEFSLLGFHAAYREFLACRKAHNKQ